MRKMLNDLNIKILLLLTLLTCSKINAQVYQIPNGNFESWSNGVPNNWNTFNTANCHLSIGCGSAQSNHHSEESGRPGSSGSKSLKIYATSILGIVANGNITTGRINIGSMTAADASNYNYTDRNNYNVVFNGTPDSLYVWTKFTAANSSSRARISVVLHGNTDFQDPPQLTSTSLYKGQATKEFLPTDWVQQKIPFVYDGTSSVNYILATFTTNKTPGGGAANDALYIDDIEMIYSAWLTDIKSNGTTISGFKMDKFDYYVEFPQGTNPQTPLPTITYTTEVNDAKAVVNTIYKSQGSIDSAIQRITVTAEDGVTQKIYNIHYSIYKSNNNNLASFSYIPYGENVSNNITVSQDTTYISLAPGTTIAPTITEYVLADTTANAVITQATSPEGVATIAVTAENGNVKIYYIVFSVALSNNANLSSITYGQNNEPLSNFSADILTYDVVLPSGTVLVPFVNATTEWAGLVPKITQASSLPGTATIVVTAEDGVTKKTYIVNFSVGISTNAALAWIKYNNNLLVDFHADTLNYSIELPYGTTQVDVEAKPANSTSRVFINQVLQIPGTATINVVAEDTNYTKTYTIDFTLAKNNNANLDSLGYSINNVITYVDKFETWKEHYDIILPSGTKEIPVIYAVTQDSNATIQIIQPNTIGDTAFINVIAEDGITEKQYSIAFTVALSTNTSIDSFQCDLPSFHFDPNQTKYYVFLDSLVMPTINIIPSDSTTKCIIEYPQKLPGEIVITIIAEDTSVVKKYRIFLSIGAPNSPDLIDLTYLLDGKEYSIDDFHSDTLIYDVYLPSQTTEIPTLKFITADFETITEVTQPQSPNGVGIVMVHSNDYSSHKMYQVHFNVTISNNANLSSISYQGEPIDNFDSDNLSYIITLPYTENKADSINAIAQHSAAQVFIVQAESYNDSAVIKVVAEDNITEKNYVVHFQRELSPIATLSSIGYRLNNADSIIHNFDATTFDYIVDIAPEKLAIPEFPELNIIPTDSRSSVYVSRVPTKINDTAQIVVVAENKIDSNIYTIVFNYLPSSNTALSALKVNGVDIENFHPDTFDYYVILPWETSDLPIISATAQWQKAKVQIAQASTTFGEAQIRVTAEDNLHQKTYSVHFQRGSNVELATFSYTLDTNNHNYTINNIDSIYHIELPIATTHIPTINYTLVDTRSIATIIENTHSSTRVDDTISLHIVGWDNLQEKTYHFIFSVELSTEALLTDLRVDNETIENFHPDTLHYAIEYEYGYSIIPIITASASQADATIDFQQITEIPQQAIITVYAGDTSIFRTYTIDFSIESGDNAFLSNISTDSTPIDNFDKFTNNYIIGLPYGSTVTPIISATSEDARATIDIIQTNNIEDTVYIIVKAINGDSNIYTLTFYIMANTDATLSNIYIDGQAISSFSSTTRNYKFGVSPTYIGIPVVTAIATDSNAFVEIEAATEIPGQTKINVTAANGVDKLTYRINFIEDINDIAENNNVITKIYPNPTNSQIIVEIEYSLLNSNFLLFDEQGKLMLQQKLDNEKNIINLNSLNKAVYFYQIQTDNNIVKIGKLIKF